MKVLDRLVVLPFSLELSRLCNLHIDLWWEKNPVLVALERSVPGTRAQRILVHSGSGPLRATEEPAVGRSWVLSKELEIVVVKVGRDLVVVDDVLHSTLGVLNRALKKVERRIISVIDHVLDELSKPHSQGVSFIILTHPKFGAPVRLVEVSKRPLLLGRPALC